MSAHLLAHRPTAGVCPTAVARRAMATVLAAGVITGGFVVLAPAPAQADSNVGGFLAHVNSLRASKGLGPLTMVSDLTSIAEGHSEAMLAKETIFHNPSLASVVTNWQTLGENVGMGPTVDALDNAFDNSPEHYANEINATYTQIGIASVTDSRGEIFVTLDFRKPMRPTAATPVPAPPAPVAAPQPVAPIPTPATTTAPTKSTTALRTPVKRITVPWHRRTAAQNATDPVARALRFAAAVSAISH